MRQPESCGKIDCGCAPVLNDNLEMAGIITGRDICMGADAKERVTHETEHRCADRRA